MALVYAIKSGSFHDPTIWNTGAVPTASDDAFINNFTINVGQNITVGKLSNTVSGSATGYNGLLNISASCNINVNSLVQYGGLNFIQTSHNSGSVNITSATAITGSAPNQACIYAGANLTSGSVVVTAPAITINGVSAVGITNVSTGNVTFIGNVVGGTAGSVISVANGTLTVVGNVTGGSSGLSYGINANNSAVSVTVTGNILGGTNATAYGIISTSGNITITGTVNNSTANAINMSSAANNLTITGNVTATSVNAISLATNGTVSITGTITAGSVAALNSTSLTATHLL